MYCINYVSFARILLLVWRNIKQHVPSIQTFLLSRNFQCAWSLHIFDNNIIAPFWQQYKMSITHCMLCRNLIFSITYCLIEGRLHLTIKGKNHVSKKGTLHAQKTALYFVEILFLEKSSAFPRRKIASYEWKVYFDMMIFLPRQHYIWQMNAS